MKPRIDWITGLIVVVIIALLILMMLEPHSKMGPTVHTALKSVEAKMVDGKIEASGVTHGGDEILFKDVVEISVKTKHGAKYFIYSSRE